MTVEELIAELQKLDPKLPVTALNEMEEDAEVLPEHISVADGEWYGVPTADEPRNFYARREGPHVRIG